MTSSTDERLYSLLPTFYVQDDAEHGQPLRALMAVLQSVLDELEANAAELYNDWFIETCSQWVVPYIGELLGVQGLNEAGSITAGQRARVANTLAYRRRKGTPAALAQATQYATGWWVHVVPFGTLLVRAQNVKHVRTSDATTLDVRDVEALRDLGGPFESIAHRVDIRGKYNMADIGLFVWRLPSYTANYTAPPSPTGPFAGDHTFHPFGVDVPLFDTPQRVVTRTAFAADLAVFRQQHASDSNPPPNSRYYGPDRALAVVRDGQPIGPLQVMSASLDWSDEHDAVVDWPPTDESVQLAVDVERGRMLFRTPPANAVAVRFTYGQSGDMGGGPYDRTESLGTQEPTYDFDVCVDSHGPCQYSLLSTALEDWNSRVDQKSTLQGRIRLCGGGIFSVGSTGSGTVRLPDRGGLTIEAPAREVAFVFGDLTVQGRTCWLGDDSVRSLTINGLIVNGRLSLERALWLRLVHSTLLPIGDSLSWNTDNPVPELDSLNLDVRVERSVLGAIRLPAIARGCTIVDSLVDGRQAGWAIAAANGASRITPGFGPSTSLAGVTILGQVAVRELRNVRNSIFVDHVNVQETQAGGITYSYVPSGSTTPRRFRCQPDLALQSGNASIDPSATLNRVRPVFTSTRYGQPGYGQLGAPCPIEISHGAEGGGEMGSFWFLNATKRGANLAAVLDEYLNVGMIPRVLYVT
jgi:hypothetical protein